MQIAATGRPRVLPDGFLQQALFEPHVGLPENVHIFFDQLPAELPEKSRRIGLIRKMEMPNLILGLEGADFLDDLLDFLRAIPRRVTFAVIAKLAAAPIATAGRQIGQHRFRNEILLQRKSVEVRRRQCRHIFGKC